MSTEIKPKQNRNKTGFTASVDNIFSF